MIVIEPVGAAVPPGALVFPAVLVITIGVIGLLMLVRVNPHWMVWAPAEKRARAATKIADGRKKDLRVGCFRKGIVFIMGYV